MDNQIKTYYIPTNPNIKAGSIYTLYINNNTNLDISSIINEDSTSKSNTTSTIKITLEINEYNKLLEVSKEIQNIINKKTNKVENFLTEERQVIKELSKLSIEYNNTLKNISVKDGING